MGKIKPRSAKNKGKRLQNWVAHRISEMLDIPVEKDGDIESRQMGMSGVDVVLRGKAQELFPFNIECKNCETWSIPKWIRQAKENQKEGLDWLLFCKKNNHEEIVVMDAERFFKLYNEYLINDYRTNIIRGY